MTDSRSIGHRDRRHAGWRHWGRGGGGGGNGGAFGRHGVHTKAVVLSVKRLGCVYPCLNGVMLKAAVAVFLIRIHDGRPQLVANPRRDRHGEERETAWIRSR